MSINKKYMIAGALATAFVLPMSNVTDSHAASMRTITGRVNFRSGPSTKHTSYGKITKGTKVTYLGSSGSWIKIKHNLKTGYVHKKYISSASTSTSTTKTKYVATSAGLNLRKGPSTTYSTIQKLSKGSKVTVISSSNGWSKVKYKNVTGYVSSSYLSSKKTSATSSATTSNSNSSQSTSSSKVISYAKKFLGKPYV